MNTLKNKVVLIFALVTVLAFGTSWFLLSGILKRSIIDESRAELTTQVEAVATYLENNGLDPVLRDAANWKQMVRGRLTIIQEDGVVLADSDADIGSLDNHGNRPEIVQAFAEGGGSSIRYSRSLDLQLLYVARSVAVENKTVVIRIALPLKTLHRALSQARKSLLLYLAVAALVVIMLEVWVIKHFFRPMENMIDVACSIAEGEPGHFPIMKNRELQRLSNSLDRMSTNLHAALDQLKEERGELSRIVTSMPIGVILLDQQKRVRYVNELARDLLQLKNEVEEGVYVERILPYKQLFDLLEDVKDKELFSFLELPERGGLYLKVSAIPTGGGVLIVITDLTEERQLEEARRTFIADASHELQTPLTTVRVTAEYLLEEFRNDPDVSKYLSTIIDQQERMTSLVDDLLLLSRIESQPHLTDKEKVDLSLLVSSLAEETGKHPYAGIISIRSDIQDDLFIMGRSAELARSIHNILDNALKYVREKFGDAAGGQIAITLSGKGNQCNLVISDNGVGITRESADRIFERFRRGDSHRARGEWGKGGYGLGLAIAKRIIEAHDGTIELVKYEEGAEFKITLPALERA
jgi:two-component system phosphate regulon sensor histidine kinase PhoR